MFWGYRGTDLHSYMVIGWQGYRVIKFQGYRVSGLHSHIVTGLPGLRVAGLKGSRVTSKQCYSVTRLKGYIVKGFHQIQHQQQKQICNQRESEEIRYHTVIHYHTALAPLTSALILSLFTQPPNTLLNMIAKVMIWQISNDLNITKK